MFQVYLSLQINKSRLTAVQTQIYKNNKLTSYVFRPSAVRLQADFEMYKEAYRSCAEGRSRFLHVFVTSLVFTYN